MGLKASDPCLAKVAENEPIFVLRAQDVMAPALVNLWADLLEAHYDTRRGGMPDPVAEKITEARGLAMRMKRWSRRKWPD